LPGLYQIKTFWGALAPLPPTPLPTLITNKNQVNKHFYLSLRNEKYAKKTNYLFSVTKQQKQLMRFIKI